MKEVVTLSPPNSLVLVMDHGAGEVPEDIGDNLVAATESCIAIGTMAAPDGETTITLADNIERVEGFDLVFDGVILTPNKEISVCNVLDEKLLVMSLSTTSAGVRVFANDLYEPDQIVISTKPA